MKHHCYIASCGSNWQRGNTVYEAVFGLLFNRIQDARTAAITVIHVDSVEGWPETRPPRMDGEGTLTVPEDAEVNQVLIRISEEEKKSYEILLNMGYEIEGHIDQEMGR